MEAKIRELLNNQAIQEQVSEPTVETVNEYVQTDVVTEDPSLERLGELTRVNNELEEQLYSAKEELFDATNKIKLLTQEFAAFKVLKEIEEAQKEEVEWYDLP